MDDIAYRRAKARVEARLGFYRHAMIYVAVNLFLIFVNLRREPGHLWFQWPLLGWGLACSGTAGTFIPIAGIRRARIR